MKIQSVLRSATLLVTTLLSISLTSCQKQTETVMPADLTKGFSVEIQRIVPAKIIDDLRSRGMVINEGQIPPKLAGTFQISPFKLLSPYGPNDTYKVDKVIDDYVYKFYGQTTGNGISYDYTNYSADKGVGKGAFIAGNGSSFTIFSEDAGTNTSVTYKTVAIISGELTAVGIRNFQYAFVLKEKSDDSNNRLIPVDAGRIWFDADKIAYQTTGARLAANMQSTTMALSLAGTH